MPKKKEYKPPHAQPKAQPPSALTAWAEITGARIAYGLQIASTSAYAAGAVAYNLFQRFYQAPTAIPNETSTALTTKAPIATEPTHGATEEPRTTAPAAPIIRRHKSKKAKPAPTQTQATRDHSESNFSGTYSEASSETARTISPYSRSPEPPRPKTAADIKELLNSQLPTKESMGDEAQGKYYQRHLKQLQKCLKNLKDTHLENDRYDYYEAQIATIGSSIEEKIIRVGQIYNQLMAELAEPKFEQNLFCMLPYSLEDSKVSGKKVAEVLEKLTPLRAIFAAQEIKIEIFLCGTSILAPSLAQDIDITIHAQRKDGQALAEEVFDATFLSLSKYLEDFGFHYTQLITDRRYTHLLSMPNAHGKNIKIDLTYYNRSVEDALSKGLTNISAVYLGVNGDMHATREIAEFYKENTGGPPKIVMHPTISEPTESTYKHIAKVQEKAGLMGWNSSEVEAWLSTHSTSPTLTSPPKSYESATIRSIPETSPIATAFRVALEAKRAATALAVGTANSP